MPAWLKSCVGRPSLTTAKARDGFPSKVPISASTSGAVIALAMTFNELCTNTTKFGALSVPNGRVEISWKIDDATQRLHLVWRETGGPNVKEPTRRSFGTRMMGSLGQQLQGEVKLSYDASGFVYVLDVPLTSLTV